MRDIVAGMFLICFLGLVFTGGALFVGHPGVAIRLSNYIFAMLFVAVMIQFFDNE